MVCLGNICRSPLAHGILEHKIKERGLDWTVDSCGTSGYHSGDPADPRSIEIAEHHGIDIKEQRSRKFIAHDFERFDQIYVMDSSNYQQVMAQAVSKEEKAKVELIMNEVNPGRNTAVPDPYYGEYGFENVYQMLDDATDAILKRFEKSK